MELQLHPETNFYSDYGIHHIPFWQTGWFWWTSIVTITIVTLVLLYSIGKKLYAWYQKKNLTAWAYALQELQNLEKQRNMGVKHMHIFAEMVRIIKTYLQKRFSAPLEHQTPQEMIHSIKTLDIEDEIKKQLHQLFTDASVLLFAPEKNNVVDLKTYVNICQTCIETTIPKEKTEGP